MSDDRKVEALAQEFLFDDGPDQRENLTEEAQSGKENLVGAQKAQIEELKRGGSSGITRDFGKPAFLGLVPQEKAMAGAGGKDVQGEAGESCFTAPGGRALERVQKIAPGLDLPADGTTIEEREGKRLIVFPNGAQAVLPACEIVRGGGDGSRRFVEYADHTMVSLTKDGVLTIEYGDGRKVVRGPDGTTVIHDPKLGTDVTVSASGERTCRYRTGPIASKVDKLDGSTQTTFTDGQTQVSYRDGTRVHVGKDGTRKTSYPDGTVVTERTSSDGLTQAKREFKDGSYALSRSDGYLETGDAQGNVTKRYPDGKTQTASPDGTVVTSNQGQIETRKKDGTVIVEKEGVKTETSPADGHVTTTLKDGTTIAKMPDGSIVTRRPDGSRLTEKDGNKTVDYAGGPIVRVSETAAGARTTEFANGSIQHDEPDKSGWVRTKNPDGSYTEAHFGPSPEHNYTLTRDKNLSYRGVDTAGNEHVRRPDGSEFVRFKVSPPLASHVKFASGGEKIAYVDGSVYERTPDGKGGATEKVYGGRPGDTFAVTRGADGKLEVTEAAGQQPYALIEDAGVKLWRDKILALSDTEIGDPLERARFIADLARFEQRAAQLEDAYRREGLSEREASTKAHKEIADTYYQLSRLMQAGDNPDVPLPKERRMQIAEQMMHQAASPTGIDQGAFNTCNVTVVEVRTYMRSPAKAARLVVDVATTGGYTTESGLRVNIDRGSLEPHGGARKHPPADGVRSLASQLFEVTAVNIHYARTGSSRRYEQKEPQMRAGAPDTGERLVDYAEDPPQEVMQNNYWWFEELFGASESGVRQPSLTENPVIGINSEITGEADGDWLVADMSRSESRASRIESEDHLAIVLAQLQARGKLPATIVVHTRNEPFYTDSGAGAAGGSGGWHVVNVTDYDPGPPALVSIDNQWGSACDHTGNKRVNLGDLYRSLRPPQH